MGIIGYELICKITPFHDNTILETYANILSHCECDETKKFIQFPSDINVSDEYKNLIESLVTTPDKRFTFTDIKEHKFFQQTDWDNIRMKSPPFIPEINGPMDTRNFEELCRNKSFRMACNQVGRNLSELSNLNYKDLNFIGYGFTYLEPVQQNRRSVNQNDKIMLLTNEKDYLREDLRKRTQQVVKLKENISSLESTVQQMSTQILALYETKDEVIKLKNVLAKKNAELATCQTQVRRLETSLKIEKDMWSRKEVTIVDMLFATRQKYEEAKSIDQARYETDITEKKTEIAKIIKKLDERNAEFAEKYEECCRLQEKIDNFSTMLGESISEKQTNNDNFTKHISDIKDFYEQQISDLRIKLNRNLESNANLKRNVRNLRSFLNEYMISKSYTEKTNEIKRKQKKKILAALNAEKSINQRLIEEKSAIEAKLNESIKSMETMKENMLRLERKLSFGIPKSGECLQQDTLYFDKEIQVRKNLICRNCKNFVVCTKCIKIL